MSNGNNKELKFEVVVVEASVLSARRAIQGLIADSEKLVKTLSNVSIGGTGGGLISGGSTSPQTSGQMQASAQSPRQQAPITGPKTLAQVFIDSSKNIKDLANVSRDSMRVMSDGIRRGIDEQRRSIAGLDSDLANLAERYKRVSQAKAISIAGGMPSDVIQKLSTNEHVLLERQQELLGKRESEHKNLTTLDERRRQLAVAMGGAPPEDEGPSGGGWGGRMRGAFGKGARWGVAGGAILGGVAAGAQEFSAQPFDFITNQARQAQAMGGMGVATRGGDLRYAAAMMQVMHDKDKQKEFLNVGQQNISTGINNTISSVVGGLMRGDVNAGGNIIRGIEGIDSTNKERLRQYMEEQVKTDPRFFSNLERFQGEADARVSMSRRTGYSADKSPWANAGEDMGTFGGAFEAVRGGGRSFAQQALWQALRANRGGMDMAAAGSLIAAGAPSGSGTQLFNSVTTGTDVVAAEHLARAITHAMQSTIFGPSSGLGIAGMMGNFGKSPIDVYRSSQMGAGIQGFGQMLGGADPLGVGINVLSANNIVGPGGDIYRVNALTELMRDPAMLADAMAGRDPHGYLQSMLGESFQGDAAKMFSETMTRNVRSRFISQGSASLSPSSKSMQKLVTDYNGDIGAFFQGEMAAGRNPDQLLTELGSGLHSILPQTFPTVQSGEAGARMFANAGGTGNVFGRGPGDASFGSAAGDYKKGRIKTTEEEMQDFIGANKTFISQLSQDMKVIGNIFERMGGIDLSADHAAKSLMALADAADGLTRKYGGTPPERAKEDLHSIRVNKQGQMEDSRQMSRSQAEKLYKGYKITGQASTEALNAFQSYGLMPKGK